MSRGDARVRRQCEFQRAARTFEPKSLKLGPKRMNSSATAKAAHDVSSMLTRCVLVYCTTLIFSLLASRMRSVDAPPAMA